MTHGSTVDVVELLRRERPSFHFIEFGTPTSRLALHERVLVWLAEHVPAGATTLETGSGYSTVVFCARSTRHTAIAPASSEFDAIRSFCDAHGLPGDVLDARVDLSQRVLPADANDGSSLDVVLIDGDHAFPTPFIDYYGVADRVVPGGWLLVDDTQLRTGHVLRAFLRAEPEWRHHADIGKTAIFQRVGVGPVTSKWWGEQPWGSLLYPVEGDGAAQLLALLRTRIRLRSRVRTVVQMGRTAFK